MRKPSLESENTKMERSETKKTAVLRSIFVRAVSLLRPLNPSDDDAAYASLTYILILILGVVGCRRKHPLCPVASMFMKSGPEYLISKLPNRPEITMMLLVNC